MPSASGTISSLDSQEQNKAERRGDHNENLKNRPACHRACRERSRFFANVQPEGQTPAQVATYAAPEGNGHVYASYALPKATATSIASYAAPEGNGFVNEASYSAPEGNGFVETASYTAPEQNSNASVGG